MDSALLLSLHHTMLLIRTVELRIAELYAEQEMRCPVHLTVGQEAAEAGACLALEQRDYVLSHHRSHGHYLAKGGSLKAMMAEIYGKASGCAKGVGGSMHLIDLEAGFLGAAPIVGSTIPIAVGVALGTKMRKEDRVTMVFLGDGATETGVFHESLNFASLKQLPIVFVCENNLYSVYSPLSVRQPEARPIVDLARAHRIESYAGDGNDAEAVYGLCKQAVNKARAGQGPTFLEFATYRWLEHCGPNYDNDIGYRTEEEFQIWKEQCPIARSEKRLLQTKVVGQDAFVDMARGLRDEMDAAVTFAKQSPFPRPATIAALQPSA